MKMTGFERSVLALSSLALLVFTPACFETGPTLDVVVLQHALQATTGDDSRCCCHVIGTAVNQSDVVVHATLKFEAYEVDEDDPIATAFEFLKDMQPGEQRSFEATGFVLPCFAMDSYELVDIDMRGLWSPPS